MTSAEIDLTGDGHGHHIPGTPYVYRHGWKLRGAKPSVAKVSVKAPKHKATAAVPAKVSVKAAPKHIASAPAPEKMTLKGISTSPPGLPESIGKPGGKVSLVDKKGRVRDNPKVLRHYRHLASQERQQMYHEAGLHLKYEGVNEDDLLEKWHDPSTSNEERVAIREELETRMKRLTVVAKALDQSITDARRENKRDWFRAWDAKLESLPGGRSVIRLRERILNDKVLDRIEPVKQWLHGNGKTYAEHLASAIAIGMLLHPLGLGVAGIIAGVAGKEAVGSVFENMFAESGIATALNAPIERVLGPIFAPFEKERRLRRARKQVLVDYKGRHGMHVGGGSGGVQPR